eukprot:scaffold135_cov90-Skeletonema_menzelii.AAC.3
MCGAERVGAGRSLADFLRRNLHRSRARRGTIPIVGGFANGYRSKIQPSNSQVNLSECNRPATMMSSTPMAPVNHTY